MLNEEESKEASDKGWEKSIELTKQWMHKAPSVSTKKEQPRLQAFFEEQQRIGSVWPEVPYPMKYDISIYREAEKCCFSSVDSPDWRKREISIRVTDAAIDLIDEILRTPIAQASCKVFSIPDLPPIKELAKDHFLCEFPASAIADFTRVQPQETRSEHSRFPINKKSNTLFVGVPYTTLIEIAERIASLPLSFEPRFGSSNGTDALRFGCRRVFEETRYHLAGELKFPQNTRPQPKVSADVPFQLPNLG